MGFPMTERRNLKKKLNNMATFEEILDNLLEGLEKDSQADVNELARRVAAEMGLLCDETAVKDVNKTVEDIDSRYSELVKAKEDGVSTKQWLRKKIMQTASEHEMCEDEQVVMLESLADMKEKELNDNLDKIS